MLIFSYIVENKNTSLIWNVTTFIFRVVSYFTMANFEAFMPLTLQTNQLENIFLYKSIKSTFSYKASEI